MKICPRDSSYVPNAQCMSDGCIKINVSLAKIMVDAHRQGQGGGVFVVNHETGHYENGTPWLQVRAAVPRGIVPNAIYSTLAWHVMDEHLGQQIEVKLSVEKFNEFMT